MEDNTHNEFDLIRQYFKWQKTRSEISLSIGDDAAVLNCPNDQQMVWTIDTLVEGIHFFPDDPAFDIGYKALAVNLSDLAAMGAQPTAFCLSLTMPSVNHPWIKSFAAGLHEIARFYQIDLVGGDTTRGPLSITITAIGWVKNNQMITRSGAKPGDQICISGQLGLSGLALKQQNQKLPVDHELLSRRLRPLPRVELGRWLVGKATAAIDVSDGLAADLMHLLDQSGLGAVVYLDRLPLPDTVRQYIRNNNDWSVALHAGDDYELCFTVGKNQTLEDPPCPVHVIGDICSQKSITWILNGQQIPIKPYGYRHFS